MHLIRRAAVRATVGQARGAAQSRVGGAGPFALGKKVQSSISNSVFRRFSSDEAGVFPDGDAGLAGGRQQGGYQSDRPQRSWDRQPRGAAELSSGFRSAARPNRPPPPPNATVYVGNLLFDITAEDLTREFGAFGTVKSAKIAADARGMSKGFGYVEFETTQQATAAIEAKHQTVFEGRRLVVNYQVQRAPTSYGQTSSNPPSKTLFIGNLAFEMSDADLNKLFREIRNVTDVRVAIDRRTGQPRGFAHADFIDVESAVKGKEALQNKEVHGRTLRVDFSSTHAGGSAVPAAGTMEA